MKFSPLCSVLIPSKPMWRFSHGNYRRRHLFHLGKISYNRADLLMKQEQKCVTKESFQIGFCFFSLQLIQRFSKLSPSLRHQHALQIIVATVKGGWFIMRISPARNSTFFLSILQLLYEERPPARIWNADLMTSCWFFKDQMSCSAS